MTEKIGITAILPAYNEAPRINKIIKTVLAVPSVKEIIVIDDGSSDGTAQIIFSHPKVKVIVLPKNVGKTWAVIEGIDQAKCDNLLLLDADLSGLYKEHLENLIKAYGIGADLAILDYGSQELVFRKILKSFPALSGVRIFNKYHFNKVVFKPSDRFELESRLNNYFLKNELKIVVVSAETVFTPHKHTKYGWVIGIWLELWALKEVLNSNGPLGVLPVFLQWRRIAKKTNRH